MCQNIERFTVAMGKVKTVENWECDLNVNFVKV